MNPIKFLVKDWESLLKWIHFKIFSFFPKSSIVQTGIALNTLYEKFNHRLPAQNGILVKLFGLKFYLSYVHKLQFFWDPSMSKRVIFVSEFVISGKDPLFY